MTKTATLVIGANGAIAKGIIDACIEQESHPVIAVSRQLSSEDNFRGSGNPNLLFYSNDYSQAETSSFVRHLSKQGYQLTRVFICNGILHGNDIKPEKRLEDFNPLSFEQVMHVNTTVPMMWLKALTPLLQHTLPATVTCLSARVGSISDNRLGGWYSYRTSKSALNMLLKTAAIEFARRAKNVKLVAFHPGSTDSPLSKPFQANVPKGKLLEPAFVARRLLAHLNSIEYDNTLSYIDWQGEPIPW